MLAQGIQFPSICKEYKVSQVQLTPFESNL